MVSVRRIRTGEGELFRALRLASLKESPSAFSTTFQSAIHRSMESWREQADRTATGAERCTFLLFSDESPEGIAAVYRNDGRKDEGKLLQMWVSPSFRGTGAARGLLDATLHWCEENGLRRLLASIRPGNDRALKFYRKHGFDFVDSTRGDATGTRVLVRNIGTVAEPGSPKS